MAPQFLRAYCERAADTAKAEPGTPIRFIASTENVARDGMVIESSGWDLENFQRNPVFLWAHDMMGARPPIGRVDKVFTKSKQLVADVTFDQGDDFARSVESKYRNGFLSAVSVSWDTREFAPPKAAGAAPRITKAELLEISAVPVPSDPGALAQRQARALRDLADELEELSEADDGLPDPHNRGAIPPKKERTAPENAAWDAGAEVKKADGADELRRMHAWVNSDADPEAKSSYKLPHHMADGTVVWRGVAAAMSRLQQGGTTIPDSDRQGVWDHLALHYRQFDKEPPELRSAAPEHMRSADDPDDAWEDAAGHMVRLFLPETRMTERERRRDYHRLAKQYRLAGREAPEWIAVDDLAAYTLAEIRGLFLEGEPDLFPELFRQPHTRESKVLSKRNRDDLTQAMSLINGVLRRAEKEAEQEAQNEPERGTGEQLDAALTELIALQSAA